MSGNMRSFLTTAVALLSIGQLSQAQNAPANESTSDCPQPGGAHIIVARASNEAPGYGIIGAVKDKVITAVPGSNSEAVVYPATLNDYVNSETAGVIAMRGVINDFVEKCPDAPLVLMGYSQGAQVTADSLAGQDVGGFPENMTEVDWVPIDEPLPDTTLARVAAVVIMGDPSLTLDESFHVGNATKRGIFPRKDVSNFDATGLANRMQSYCDEGDPYCASGSFSTLIVHLKYVAEYGQNATDFVVSQLKNYKGSSSTNGTTGGATPSGKPTPSSNSTSPSATAPATGTTPTGPSSSPVYTGAASHLQAAGLVSAGLVGAMVALGL